MSALMAIGSLIPLLMVPRGRYEPEYQIGHTRISSSNKNYVETQVGDDAINGGLVNSLTLLHAARVTPAAVTSVLRNDHCSDEWPPWPNFELSPAPKCSAFGPPWTNGSEFEGDNFWSKAAELVQEQDRLKPFKVTGQSEADFLDRYRQESTGNAKRKRFQKPKIPDSKESQESGLTQGYSRTTAEAAPVPHFLINNSLELWLMAVAMANLTTRDPPRPTYRNDSASFRLKFFDSSFTNEFWALGNHHHFYPHFCNFLAASVLCILWIIACVQGAWHFGLTAVRMRRDLMTHSPDHIINPVHMRSAVTMIDVIQHRQSCMHKVVYTICKRCKAWVCITCGMITICTHHCVMEDIRPGHWGQYRQDCFDTMCRRAEALQASFLINDLDNILAEMSLSLAEYLSARAGAINCDESTSLGYDQETGDPFDNLQPYSGERIYKAINSFSPSITDEALKRITDLMRYTFLADVPNWVPRREIEPRYLKLFACMLCKMKCRLKYCLLCDAWVCLACGVVSACTCDYGSHHIVGAHDWMEAWMEIIDYRNSLHDITFLYDRMPNPFQSSNGPQSFTERCPLCTERYGMNEFLEYGVGRLFVVCFGCNRKYCSSAKPGTDPRYIPCQYAMECTCDTRANDDLRCHECNVDDNDSIDSMMWFDHIRLVLAGMHYLFACSIRIVKTGVELLTIATVGIMCAVINYIPGMPIIISMHERADGALMNNIKNDILAWHWLVMEFISMLPSRMMTPQSLMRQVIIEMIFLCMLVIVMHASIISLAAWSLMIGTHYAFHKLTHRKSHQFIHFVALLILMSNLVTVNTTGSAHVERFEDILPGVKEWNGKRFYDFRIVWWPALLAALGSIAQDGWTLLQVARGQDPGAPGAGGTAAQIAQSINRNIRLFNCMIKYIHHKSWLYQFTTTQFPGNGRGLFNYVWEFGHKPLTTLKQTKLMDEWQHMTMANTCGKYRKDSILDWAEKVDVKGARIGKNNAERRAKFYEGFPESFGSVIAYERMIMPVGSYVYPADYVAHDPRAGNAHPHAGEPDILACARAFEAEWERMIVHGLIKSAPRGSVHQVVSSSEGENENESDNESADESASMAKSAVNERTVCLECGGLGHAADVDGKIKCPNLILKTKIDRSTLEQIKYPNGITRPKFNFNNKKGKAGDFKKRQQAQASNESNEQSSDDDDEANYTRKGKGKGKFGKKRFGKKRFVPKSKSKSAKQVQSESSESESNNDNDEEGEHEGGSAMMIDNESSSDNESVIMKLKRKIKSIEAKQMESSQTDLAVSFDNVRI